MKKIILACTLITILFVSIGCSVRFTTANYSNIQMASEIDDSNNKPINTTTIFDVTAPMLYVTGTLNNAPDGTVIKAEWLYIDNDPVISIDSVELEIKDVTTDFYFSLSKPNNDWPTGKYEVKLYIDDEYKQSVNFEVK